MLAHFSSEQLWRGLLRVACIAGVCVRAGEQRSTEWERIAGRRPALSVVQRQHGLEHTGVLTILPTWSTQSWAFQGVRALCVAYKIEVAWQHNQQPPPAGYACGCTILRQLAAHAAASAVMDAAGSQHLQTALRSSYRKQSSNEVWRQQ